MLDATVSLQFYSKYHVKVREQAVIEFIGREQEKIQEENTSSSDLQKGSTRRCSIDLYHDVAILIYSIQIHCSQTEARRSKSLVPCLSNEC